MIDYNIIILLLKKLPMLDCSKKNCITYVLHYIEKLTYKYIIYYIAIKIKNILN